MFPMRVERFGNTYRLIQFKNMNMCVKRSKTPYIHSLAEDEGEYWERRWEEQEGRWRSSVARSRSRVRELALCNEFDYFCTFTLSPEKQDRNDLRKWVKDFGNWVGNYNKKYKCKLEYVIIPEQHKNGAWHAHGLVKGLAPDSIVKNEHGYYDLPYYAERFGFMNFSAIKSRERVASYVTKYITKDLSATCHALGRGAHMFYASRGLKGKEILWSGYGDFKADTENAFCKIAYVDFSHAMEVIGRSLLALKKSPYETNKQLFSRILNLEQAYEMELKNVEKNENYSDSAKLANAAHNGGRNAKRQLLRSVRLCCNGRRKDPTADITERISKYMGWTMGYKTSDRQNGKTDERTARRMIEEADRKHTEETMRRHEQICYATSQGGSCLNEALVNVGGHWRTEFTLLGK